MRYFLIAGEASGDLHASNLMAAIRQEDSDAQFCFFGGDRMSAVGGVRLRHYKNIAYMGFIPVVMHLNVIMYAMKVCKLFILRWKPDVVILVDYPGFNLSIAKYVHENTNIPVYYYISPKIWAWKEHRIKQIRAYVNELFSILPFEIPFFEEKHHYPIHYVGNPSVDEITAFQEKNKANLSQFAQKHALSLKPMVALLPGSRRQEIKDNLRKMSVAAQPLLERGYQIVVAGVSDIPESYYAKFLSGLNLLRTNEDYHLLNDCTPQILLHAHAALVTSGTATLETAIFRVPQVVCYYAPLGPIVRFLKKKFLKVPYISLVNLIVGREVVPELVADEMNVTNLRTHLYSLLGSSDARQTMLDGYADMLERLGPAGAPKRAAKIMVDLLTKTLAARK